jgi:uncharacterized protein YndB with AHSA1/START domain
MPTKILIAIAVIIIIFLVIAALQPADFRVVRSATIAAPPAVVFEQVNNLRNWEAWSPWAKLDPNMKTRYEGATAGSGASYAWVGNHEVGEGRMTITDSRPTDSVDIRLEFVKPFACTNAVEFTFKPEDDQTTVTWSMAGKKNFMAKAVHLVMNMDKMVGGMFEKGLGTMKSVAEGTPRL